MSRPDADIVAAAVLGILDADERTLNAIQKAVNNRREYLLAQERVKLEATVCVGDYMFVASTVKPQYLRNCEVRVLEYRSTSTVLVEVVSVACSPKKEVAKKRTMYQKFVLDIGLLRDKAVET